MDPLLLAAIVGIATTVVLFSGIPVGIGLLLVSVGFIIIFDGTGSLPLLPEILFGKLESFEVLAIPMFILMGAVVASSRAGGDLYSVLDRWLTRVPGVWLFPTWGHARFSALSGSSRQPVLRSAKWAFRQCANAVFLTRLPPDRLLRVVRLAF